MCEWYMEFDIIKYCATRTLVNGKTDPPRRSMLCLDVLQRHIDLFVNIFSFSGGLPSQVISQSLSST